MRKITTLVGLEAFKNEVSGFVRKAALYKTLGKKPPALILHLDSRQGRTTAANYLVDNFAVSELHDFAYAREELVELGFDGSFDNSRENISYLEENSDFANVYSNICAISGLDKLAKHMGEIQIELFLDKVVGEVAKSGYLLIFVSSDPRPQEIKLLDKVKERLPSFKEGTPVPYTVQDYADAATAHLNELGVTVVGEIADLLAFRQQSLTMAQAMAVAENAAMEAELVNNTPVLTIDTAKTEREVK